MHTLARSALLFAAVAALVVLSWYLLGRPEGVPPSPLAAGERLNCVSYAPYHGNQSPFTKRQTLPETQIADDLARLSKITSCVRTYSSARGLDRIAMLAGRYHLSVLQGIWLGRNEAANRREIEQALRIARMYPDVVKAFIVGNEVLLRGEQAPAKLADYLKEVHQRSGLPVTYADVWEYWLKAPELADSVDFVTIHILPYWEDIPVAADDAVSHVQAIRELVAKTFPGKEILIGEVGWPSEGRMREGALPSPVNQARVLAGVVAAAKAGGWKVNYIEGFDQPWKRLLEGTVGGYWGLFDDAGRAPKFTWGMPLSNHPHWAVEAGLGVLASFYVFLAAWFGTRDSGIGLRQELGVAAIALVSGLCFGWAAINLPMESALPSDGIRGALMLLLAFVVPALAAASLGRGVPLEGFASVLNPRYRQATNLGSYLFGFFFAATCVAALVVALGLVFDPRYKDFPLAVLTAPAVASALAAFANRAPISAPGRAELTTALVLAASAIFVVFNEGTLNWQALWFAALLVLLALTALQARPAPG